MEDMFWFHQVTEALGLDPDASMKHVVAEIKRLRHLPLNAPKEPTPSLELGFAMQGLEAKLIRIAKAAVERALARKADAEIGESIGHDMARLGVATFNSMRPPFPDPGAIEQAPLSADEKERARRVIEDIPPSHHIYDFDL